MTAKELESKGWKLERSENTWKFTSTSPRVNGEYRIVEVNTTEEEPSILKALIKRKEFLKATMPKNVGFEFSNLLILINLLQGIDKN